MVASLSYDAYHNACFCIALNMKTICLHIFRYISKRSFPEVSLVMRIKAMRNAAENNCMCTEVTD